MTTGHKLVMGSFLPLSCLKITLKKNQTGNIMKNSSSLKDRAARGHKWPTREQIGISQSSEAQAKLAEEIRGQAQG